MMKNLVVCAVLAMTISGCNVSPLSPSNRNSIKNNSGEIGDTKNNQNGIMAEIMSLKGRMDLMARDVENIQNGFINHNNRNNGVQIFQGDGGIAVGLSLLFVLAVIALNYKLKSEKYKKTAELFAQQVKEIKDPQMEEKILVGALERKIESEVFKMLKN
jgi:hypothetical protein